MNCPGPSATVGAKAKEEIRARCRLRSARFPAGPRRTTMTLTSCGLIVTLVLNGMLTLAMAQHLFAEGRILAVGWQQGTVLLETHKGFSLVAVDPAAKIEDRLGTGRSLTDLQPGDVVECRIEPFAGIPIAEEIHVLSESLGDQRSEDRRR